MLSCLERWGIFRFHPFYLMDANALFAQQPPQALQWMPPSGCQCRLSFKVGEENRYLSPKLVLPKEVAVFASAKMGFLLLCVSAGKCPPPTLVALSARGLPSLRLYWYSTSDGGQRLQQVDAVLLAGLCYSQFSSHQSSVRPFALINYSFSHIRNILI